MPTTERQAAVLRAVGGALIETVKSAGAAGAPAGPMYAAVMGLMSLDQFEQFMSALVNLGKVRKSGHVYFFVADL